jgi:hypothetical protein
MSAVNKIPAFSVEQIEALVLKSERSPFRKFSAGEEIEFSMVFFDQENFENSIIFQEDGRKLTVKDLLGLYVEGKGTEIVVQGDEKFLPWNGKRETLRQLLVSEAKANKSEEIELPSKITIAQRIDEGSDQNVLEGEKYGEALKAAYAAKNIVTEGKALFPRLLFNSRPKNSDPNDPNQWTPSNKILITLEAA